VAPVSRKISKTGLAGLIVPGDAQRLQLFCPSPLIEGENVASYNELLARVCAGIEPADLIEELLTADVAFSQWEILLWRRSKWSLVQARALAKLEYFLAQQLKVEMFSEQYIADVVEIFRDVLSEEYAHKAETWAQGCARGDAHAIDNLDQILGKSDQSAACIWLDARNKKAHELVQGSVRREPDPMRVVNELLTDAQKSMDDFIAEALAEELDKTERIDRLITLAEGRRNAAFREIDRRRASLGERLRRSVQQIEHDELSLIETAPAKGKNAA
jgi:hypothetical protein